MSVFTNEEKVQILSDVVEIESVNDHEKDVAEYLQKLLTNTISNLKSSVLTTQILVLIS